MLVGKYFIALITGVFWVALWPVLPNLGVLCLVAGLLLLGAYWWRLPVVAIFSVGTLYGAVIGHQLLAMQLPMASHQQDFIVTGFVNGLPDVDSERTRFYFTVTEINGVATAMPLPAKLRLSWYTASQAFRLKPQLLQPEPLQPEPLQPEPLQPASPQPEPAQPQPLKQTSLKHVSHEQMTPGQRWRFKVRLRRPRGTLNPGGFDYQRWLLRQGVAATGYIKNSQVNRYLGLQPGFSFDRGRYKVSAAIDRLPYSEAARGVLKALTIGDRQQISAADWRVYSGLGLAHLLVISGLHVGLAAGLAYALAVLMAKLAALYFTGITTRYWGAVAAITAGAGYGSLAGWSIPTQRAFVMVAVAALLVLLNHTQQKALGFLLAMAVVAVLDPLAIWNAGFWLSFAAVAVLLWWVPNHTDKQSGRAGWLLYMVRTQLIISFGLLPFLLMLDLPVSLLMPLVNFVAIPWISFLVVPLCLAGVLVLPLFPLVADQLWYWAVLQLQWFMQLCRYLSEIGPTLDRAVLGPGLWPLVAVLLGVLLLLLPKGFGVRITGLLLLVGGWLHQPDRPPLRVAVLDVGQGLAVVVETSGHTLVYDSGPFYSEQFDAGSGIVAPFLRQRGIKQIDTLVVSHADNDHAGGAGPLVESLRVRTVLVDPLMTDWLEDVSLPVQPCRAGMTWRWDNVDFRMLSPTAPYPKSDNNRSCVLQISWDDKTIVLPGDIERQTELMLLKRHGDAMLPASVSLLVAPHHGSNTSSSRGFVDHLRPAHVVFSSGYQHHFGHPHDAVVKRYRQVGARLWKTADSGAIQFVWTPSGRLEIVPERERFRRFWHW